MSLVTNNISGSFHNSSSIGITGSVIVANRPHSTFPAHPGGNVTFFVSGSKGSLSTQSPDTTVFGGDVVVSGTVKLAEDRLEIASTQYVTYLDSKVFLNIAANGGGVDINDGGGVRLVTSNVRIGSTFFNVPIGTDASFFVSGTLTDRGSSQGKLSVFGGQVVASGTVHALGGLTGSLTKLVDGTSYLIAGGGTTITTGSNGAVTLASIPSGSNTQVQFNDGGSFAGSSGLTYDKTTTSLTVAGDITGSNIRLTGDVAVIGGDLTSTSATFNLVNSSVTTVNIGGGATTVNIGGSTSTGSLSGDLAVSGRSNLGTVIENILTSNGGTGTVAFNIASQSIFYAKAPTGNITANFTNVPTTTSRVISTNVILSQSSPAYIVSAVQIDGVAQTLNWVNGVQPSGTANKHDVFGFSLIRSGTTPTWVVLGQMSTYG
jgi:hypothetical protein